MATFGLIKKTIFDISKSLPKNHPHCAQSGLSRACFCTSFESVQDPRNWPPIDAGRQEEQREEGFVVDTAGPGAADTTAVAEDLTDLSQETTDVAWDSVKQTTQKVSETLVAEADENIVDTTEYRSIEDLSKFNDDDDHPKHHYF